VTKGAGDRNVISLVERLKEKSADEAAHFARMRAKGEDLDVQVSPIKRMREIGLTWKEIAGVLRFVADEVSNSPKDSDKRK
jgi:hypothetical protein